MEEVAVLVVVVVAADADLRRFDDDGAGVPGQLEFLYGPLHQHVRVPTSGTHEIVVHHHEVVRRFQVPHLAEFVEVHIGARIGGEVRAANRAEGRVGLAYHAFHEVHVDALRAVADAPLRGEHRQDVAAHVRLPHIRADDRNVARIGNRGAANLRGINAAAFVVDQRGADRVVDLSVQNDVRERLVRVTVEVLNVQIGGLGRPLEVERERVQQALQVRVVIAAGSALHHVDVVDQEGLGRVVDDVNRAERVQEFPRAAAARGVRVARIAVRLRGRIFEVDLTALRTRDVVDDDDRVENLAGVLVRVGLGANGEAAGRAHDVAVRVDDQRRVEVRIREDLDVGTERDVVDLRVVRGAARAAAGEGALADVRVARHVDVVVGGIGEQCEFHEAARVVIVWGRIGGMLEEGIGGHARAGRDERVRIALHGRGLPRGIVRIRRDVPEQARDAAEGVGVGCHVVRLGEEVHALIARHVGLLREPYRVREVGVDV